MDSDEIHRRAEERRRKVIANAEARLKRITDLAKSENMAQRPCTNTSDNEFVEFDVDTFVNEPSKPANNGSPKFPVNSNHLDSLPESSNSAGGANRGTLNGCRNIPDPSQLGRTSSEEFIRMFQEGSFGPNNFMFPPAQGSSVLPTGQRSNPNEMNQMNLQDLNNSMNAMFAGQNPADLSNLLNLVAGLASASGPMPRAPPPGAASTPQEEPHPALKPILNIVVFLILGVMSRIFFQFSTLKINVFAPFLCLAVPLAIMSWGRKRTPVTGLLSAVMLFIRNPRTQSLILNWVRLTTLLRGLSRLFACYFFTFVITHVVFELSTIHKDINQHSSPAD
uniref:Cytochrome P450 1A1 n=1 Tax=Lygus hesperus TaxID=30085 RepID=A0A0A9X2I5_LYGHE